MITRRAFGLGAALAPWAAGAAAARAAPEPHALADFYADRHVYDAALSPDGGRIAVLRSQIHNLARAAFVDIVDAADPGRIVKTLPLGETEIHYVEWGSEDRLLVTVSKPAPNPFTGMRGGKAEYRAYRIVSVRPNGLGSVALFNDPDILRTNYDLATVVDYLPDDPLHILMMAADHSRGVYALYKVNLETGAAVQAERGRESTVGWFVNRGVAVLRLDSNARGTVNRIFARAPGTEDWRFVLKVRTDQAPEFSYVGPAPSGDYGAILVAARAEGEDVMSLRELDLRTLAFGPPIARRDGLDVDGGLVDERGRWLATRYVEDRVTYDFADKSLAAHFKGINTYLGNERNVRIFDVDGAQNRLIARATGPRDPGQFIYYDKQARNLTVLGAYQPSLSAERLGKAEALTVKTRDGAEIRAYLTAPPSGAKGPLVVYPHGGPEARDLLDWDRTVQILAAQGWWVLQPQFRGSGGFGQGFVNAGARRWGDRMQEDVEDCVAHVVAAGKADARKVAIAGASYGGYAALMGAVRRPDLYRACVPICGVSDLPAILKSEKKDDPDSYDYWVRSIGDPAADKAMLEAASPARRASEIACPVLLIHGVDDRVVPVEQSRIMARALKAAGRPHELIEVPNAGHADWDDERDKALMTHIVAFLAKAFG